MLFVDWRINMARSVNKVTLLGNVGKDPEIRSTPSGVMVASFGLATSDRFQDAQGNWQDRTEWHNLKVVFFAILALQGVLLNVLPANLLARLSVYVQGALGIFGLLALALSAVLGIRKLTPDEFQNFREAPLAKIAMNFRLVERDAAHCTVITETRVYAGGAPVVRRFAAYWRVIYPGSALMRHMWLRAIKLQAEGAK